MEKTPLEKQEEEIGTIFGNPQGINAADKSMLEISPTNRLIIDSNQSELQIGVNLIYSALVAQENRKIEYKRVKDNQSNTYRMEKVIKDSWKWLNDLDQIVRTNQLTIKGFSRAQHLRQQASMLPIAPEEEQQNFWQRIFGR